MDLADHQARPDQAAGAHLQILGNRLGGDRAAPHAARQTLEA
jgi:hypothetical protein